MKDLKTILTSCGDLFPIPFVIADFTHKDQPLIFISDSFMELTGYQREDVIGKNCRFLQGEKTDQTTVKNIRKSLDNNECCYYDILNHKKNGDVFWNRLALFPVGPTADTCTYYVGIQMEISASSERISKFNDDIKKNQIAKKVKNPFQEIMNAQRASDLVFFNPSEITYEDFVEKIKKNVQDICSFIKSL